MKVKQLKNGWWIITNNAGKRISGEWRDKEDAQEWIEDENHEHKLNL